MGGKRRAGEGGNRVAGSNNKVVPNLFARVLLVCMLRLKLGITIFLLIFF